MAQSRGGQAVAHVPQVVQAALVHGMRHREGEGSRVVDRVRSRNQNGRSGRKYRKGSRKQSSTSHREHRAESRNSRLGRGRGCK